MKSAIMASCPSTAASPSADAPAVPAPPPFANALGTGRRRDAVSETAKAMCSDCRSGTAEEAPGHRDSLPRAKQNRSSRRVGAGSWSARCRVN